MAAEFEGAALEIVGRKPRELAPHRRRAGEGDLADGGCGKQMARHGGRIAEDEIDHAGRQSRLGQRRRRSQPP